MKTDELLIAQLEDKIQQADDWGVITSGDFLDVHQRKVLMDYVRGRKLPVRLLLYGGYDDAERCMPVFLPEYLPDIEVKASESGAGEAGGGHALPPEVAELLKVVRVTAPKGGRQLTHRDYLGSLLALGLDREVTGDILVRKGEDPLGAGADIIVEAGIADFIEMNYDKAGRTNLKASVLPITELHVAEVETVKKHDTVASLRLDNIVSSAFNLSRAKAADAIRRGIVSVNNIETIKPDMDIEEGDKIVLRGKGKTILREVSGKSRKDRIRILLELFI
ncbi:MAG: YlmH/Sll1252 family protein [Bacillota bacterium]|nr:YlmH/Sll1252 family protein [Bacillota bacterium]